jgi:hypothetical protein
VEVTLVFENVADDTPQEGNVAARPDGDVNIGHGARPRKPWIDVNQRSAVLARFHHPLEGNGMALRHIRALDNDYVRVHQIGGIVRGAATAK